MQPKDVQQSRKLKKTRSDVSVDSLGIPKELASPLTASDASPPRIWNQKKFGQKQSTAREASEDEGHVNLQEAMGFQEACSCLEKGKNSLQTLEKGFEEQETCHKQPLEKGQDLEKGWQRAMGKDQEHHG